jgi:ABC-2 type transport system ATP-binding protein
MIRAPDLEDAMFQRCSTGMKQKLSLARALLADPPILLLDEPTRSLDPASQHEFHALLRRTLAEGLGKTVLFVTHNLQEAESVCDRVALLENGRIAGVWPAGHLPAGWRFETTSEDARPSRRAGEA